MPEKKKRILEAEVERLQRMLDRRREKVVDAERKLTLAKERLSRG